MMTDINQAIDETQVIAIDNRETIIEENQRLSLSLLWQLQQAFFDRQGIDAWRNDTVPSYITSNPYIAKVYARLVFAWLRDMVAISALDVSQPIYILELGAGSGRLAYHFLKKFYSFFTQSVLKDIPITYIMTDYSQRNLDFWQEQPQLQPFVAAGQLDFAFFDVMQDRTLKLVKAGETLSPETLKNPLIIIGNYFFDSLIHDAFRIEKGQLHESLVSLVVPHADPDLDDPDLLRQVTVRYTNRPTTTDYYDDPAFNQILLDYEQSLVRSTFLFPIGALQCLRNLYRLTEGRFVFIAGDKGYHREIDLLFRREPSIARHGSISMMVNYHALAQYIGRRGGQFLGTTHGHMSLDVCLFLSGPHPHNYPETRQVYDLAVEQGGPDDFFALKGGVEAHYAELSLPQLLAYLRLSDWDSNIFLGCFPNLLKQIESASDTLRAELHRVVNQLWDTYYHLGEERDLPFCLGILLYGLAYYADAIIYLQHSLRLYGPDVSTLYNLGLCHYELQQPEPALEFITQALAIEATFEPAQAIQSKLQEELRRQ